jgi:hypothetical protein
MQIKHTIKAKEIKDYPEIKKKLWKEKFGSPSFCLITTGRTPIEVIKKFALHR